MEEEIYLNNDVLTFNNDASASSFGWNFQANAGIFLFLQDIKNYKDIKIESKYQDIEITKNDGTKILAQAKSSVDFSRLSDSARKSKLKDALFSLAKNANVGDKLIFISNIPSILKKSPNTFNNLIVDYDNFLGSMKDEIDEILSLIRKEINDAISIEKSVKNKNKLNILIKSIDNFPKQKLCLSVIYPFFGDSNSRYVAISNAIVSFLTDKIGLSLDIAISLKSRLLTYWQNKFNHNSTIKDSFENKSITKYSFAWPIVVYLAEDDLPNDITCTFPVTDELKRSAALFLSSEDSIMLEQFEIVNKIINAFASYLTNNPSSKNVEIDFINKNWNSFGLTFNYEGDNQKKEYFSKIFVRKVLSRFSNIKKINTAIGVK